MIPEVAARGEIAAGWVDYVASGQFAEVIHDHPQAEALEIIRQTRIAWYAGVSHGIRVLVEADTDPEVILAVADELLAFVEQEEARRRGRG